MVAHGPQGFGRHLRQAAVGLSGLHPELHELGPVVAAQLVAEQIDGQQQEQLEDDDGGEHGPATGRRWTG